MTQNGDQNSQPTADVGGQRLGPQERALAVEPQPAAGNGRPALELAVQSADAVARIIARPPRGKMRRVEC